MKKQTNHILVAKDIAKSYQVNDKKSEVFTDLQLDIQAGEHVAIMGSSGSGKSTLLNILAALDSPDSGSVFFKETDLTTLTDAELAILRQKQFGFVFQSFYLIPSLSTLENVMFPLELLGVPTKEAKAQALELLERVKLSHRVDSFPYQLSGGEKQRAAMARAVINKPAILFADEPTGNLDEENSEAVFQLLLDLQKEVGSTLIVITHEPDIAQKADRILVLENKHIKQS